MITENPKKTHWVPKRDESMGDSVLGLVIIITIIASFWTLSMAVVWQVGSIVWRLVQ